MKHLFYLILWVCLFSAFVMNAIRMFDPDPIQALSGKVGMFGFLLLMNQLEPPKEK